MIKRKLEEIASWFFRNTIFHIIKIITEIKTGSIFKQKAYFNQGCIFEGKNYLGKETYISHVNLGFASYISDRGILKNTKIGRYVSIGTDVRVVLGKHPTGTLVAMHPAFYSEQKDMGFTYCDRSEFQEFTFLENGYQIVIGNDVWIGNDVKIMEGVSIGDGAVIGAGALVTKDVEPYGIYMGVPAKNKGYRFSEEQIQKLHRVKWWEKDEQWIKEHIREFTNINEFLDRQNS